MRTDLLVLNWHLEIEHKMGRNSKLERILLIKQIMLFCGHTFRDDNLIAYINKLSYRLKD